jgi:hypothetical protein
MKRLEQAEPVADTGCRHAERAAQIPQHLPDQGAQLVVVNIAHYAFSSKSHRTALDDKKYINRSIDRIRSFDRFIIGAS